LDLDLDFDLDLDLDLDETTLGTSVPFGRLGIVLSFSDYVQV